MSDNQNIIYETIISDMSEGLMVISFDGVITLLNDAAEEILARKREELIGKKFARCFFFHEENDEFNQAILDAIYDRKKTHRKIVPYFDDTHIITKQLSITTSFLHNGPEKIGIVIVLSDISELEELRDVVKAMERIKSLNEQLEMRNKLLSNTFGRFLSDDIVKELLDTPGGLQLGGKKRNISIMMSDLRGFTVMCESLEPQDLIAMLNHYITVMAEIISKYKGTIIEFLGDGILVIFGAPIESQQSSLNAVAAAVEMQMAMPEVNVWNREHNYPELKMGIGISTGETIVGNIGSEKHTKYGVIGKYVNLCGRIEGFTTGGQVLISSETRNDIKEPLEIGKSFKILPKGIKEPVEIFDVIGIGGRFNTRCPQIETGIVPCKKHYDIEFSVLRDKYVEVEKRKGKIVAISKTHAVIATDEILDNFTNIEILDETDIYCKVIQSSPDGYLVSFTTCPDSLIEKIRT